MRRFKIDPASHLRGLAFVLLLGTLGSSVYYWWRLLESHEQLRATTVAAANRRAMQLADAKASELDALILGVDASLRQFRSAYQASGKVAAGAIAESAMRSFPGQAIRFFSVIDTAGTRVFGVPPTEPMYMGYRHYFSFHQANVKDELLIDKPVIAKRDDSWTTLVSRPLLDQGRFVGVVVIGLSVEYLAERLAELQIGQGDVVTAFFSDGAYLARSRDWREAMEKTLPSDRPFLGRDAPEKGLVRLQAVVDKQLRAYAWHRLSTYPLILTVGLDEAELLEPVNRAIAQSVVENAVANLVIVVLMVSVIGLLMVNARRQARVLASETLLRSTLNATHDGIVVTDAEDRVMDANQQFLDLIDLQEAGIDSPASCVGRSFECIYTQLAQPEEFRRQRLAQQGGDEKRWEVIQLKNGRFLEAYKKIFVIDGKTVRLWCFRDITQRLRHEAELKALATTDALTSLPNRRAFMLRLQEEIDRARRVGRPKTSLLMLDIDHFKFINDTHGHVAGDTVLRTFAGLLLHALRKTDMAGRLGGEEFGIILVDADVEAAHQYAERLRQTVHDTVFVHDGPVIPVTVSMGVTAIDAGDVVPDDVLGRVDGALYRAKEKGRDRVEVASVAGGA